MHTSRLLRLKKAVEARDQKLTAIAKKLADVQRIMSNHSVQLCALYEGRRNDLATMLPPPKSKKSEDSAAAAAAAGAGGVDKSSAQDYAQEFGVAKKVSSKPATDAVKMDIKDKWEAANALC